jgi:hypothetical protein
MRALLLIAFIHLTDTNFASNFRIFQSSNFSNFKFFNLSISSPAFPESFSEALLLPAHTIRE